jgi:hypothetical protein
METKQVAAGLGVGWFKQGWSLFRKDPTLWILLTLIWVAVTTLIFIIPFVGRAIGWVVGPAFYSGFIYSASELDQGRELRAEYLFRGLTDPDKRTPFIILGAITFVFYIFIRVIGATFFMMPGIEPGAPVGAEDILGIFLRMLISVLLSLMMFVTLTYSGPSIMFRGTEPLEAVMDSAGACLKNWRPLLVFIGLYWLLAILAAIPFGLGFFVLIPVTFCALYYSFKDIYGTG